MEDTWEVDPLSVVCKAKLGKGQSGDVHLAEDGSGRQLALKTVPITLQTTDVAQLLQQLRELYSSRHPNVTAFYGAAYDEKSSLVMIACEYMDMKSLKDLLLRSRTLPEAVMGNCALQVVRGLRYLHSERRIIHRDIKPNNVLVNSSGAFKITDFGMSKGLSDAFSAGQTWIGTNAYMSPERVGGLDYSFNADVWSLGLMTYQCCTGLAPYQGSNTFELLDQIVDGDPPVLPRAQFSNEACDFVSLCLKKGHNERPGCDFLISHPFAKKYADTDVRGWLQQVA
eukprot:CAMPEP_0173440474 /NCGR_PEP_ID=MMETSP1357-20121228/22951_1 /TAXON_ID=77926 /ORGANISM="Hemiselmis rufescens, Strain PCC563" /LENGTH=282 /DNA_ID=CAMNT_0014405953 /DNA_START=93 /DNA_END=937 /DNA_ORIENTATION=-